MKLPPIDRNAGSSPWSECVNQSESFHFRPPDRPLPGYLDPDPALSQKLALKYKRWSCASENFLLSKCETETSNRKRFLATGSETVFRLKPVVQRIPPVEEHFVDQECRFWSCLLSRLKFLALLVERNKGIQQRASIIKYIRNALYPYLRGMILKTDVEVRQRGLCELFHRLQLVTHGTLNPAMVIGDVAVFQKEAEYAVLSKSSAEFKQWCHKSLAKGAAGAHASLRKADEPPQIHVTFKDQERKTVQTHAQRYPWGQMRGENTGRSMITAGEQTSSPQPSSKPETKRSSSRMLTGTPSSRLGRSLELCVP